MVYGCLLCKSNSKEDKDISFHLFPKDAYIRKQWMSACGCLEGDNVSTVRLCSKHFANKRISIATGKAVTHLDRGAVPSIGVPNPLQISLPAPVVSINNATESADDGEILTSFRPKSPVNNNEVFSNCGTPVDVHQTFIVQDAVDEDLLNSQQIIPNADKENISVDVYSGSLNNNPEDNEADNCNDFVEDLKEPVKKRRYYEPRYPSEVTLDDFNGSPRKARSVLTMIKETDHRKSKELEKLRKQATYFKKQMGIYRDMLKDSKSQNLLNTESEIQL